MILDSLVTGRREFTAGRIFYHGDIADGALVDRIFAEHPDIAAAVHCAALIVVPESVADPVRYYRANVAKSLDFAASLLRNGCQRLIFSSSAAIYAPGADLSVRRGLADRPAEPVRADQGAVRGDVRRHRGGRADRDPVAALLQPDRGRPEDADRAAAAPARATRWAR